MSNLDIGIIGTLVALGMIALRVPIGLSLGLVSIGGIAAMFNMNVAFGTISATPFEYVGQWELTAAPMFLLMGFICSSTNMTKGLFEALRLYLARLPGGLAIASVGACAFFAAAAGSSVATASAMSRIAVPEMLRNNYDRGLATGTIETETIACRCGDHTSDTRRKTCCAENHLAVAGFNLLCPGRHILGRFFADRGRGRWCLCCRRDCVRAWNTDLDGN
jgi:hypothetical protein